MTIPQIIFIFLWCCITLLSTYWVLRAKKVTTGKKIMLMVIVIVLPIFSALLVYFTLHETRDLPWQNSATKDTMWIAENDINGHSHVDD